MAALTSGRRRRRQQAGLIAGAAALASGVSTAMTGGSVLRCLGYSATAFAVTALFADRLWVWLQHGRRNVRAMRAGLLPVRAVPVPGNGSVELPHRYRAAVSCALMVGGIAVLAGAQTGSAQVAFSVLVLVGLSCCFGFFSARQAWRTAKGVAVTPSERDLLEKVSAALKIELELTAPDPRRARQMTAYLAGVWILTVAVSMLACHAAPTWRSISAHTDGLINGLIIGLGTGVVLTVVLPGLRPMALSPLRQRPGDWLVDMLAMETVTVAQLGCRRPRRAELRAVTPAVAEAARRMLMPGPAVAISHDPLPAVAAAPRTLIVHESVLRRAASQPHTVDAPAALTAFVQHGLGHIRLGHPLIAALLIHQLADQPSGRRQKRPGRSRREATAPRDNGARARLATCPARSASATRHRSAPRAAPAGSSAGRKQRQPQAAPATSSASYMQRYPPWSATQAAIKSATSARAPAGSCR